MKSDLFIFFVFMFVFTIGRYSGYLHGKEEGYKDYYKGKVECIEVFNKIECRLKPNNS